MCIRMNRIVSHVLHERYILDRRQSSRKFDHWLSSVENRHTEYVKSNSWSVSLCYKQHDASHFQPAYDLLHLKTFNWSWALISIIENCSFTSNSWNIVWHNAIWPFLDIVSGSTIHIIGWNHRKEHVTIKSTT